MNLDTVIDPEYGLQQDEYSLSHPCFGSSDQLMVVGWSGRDKGRDSKKYYVLKCNKCSQDQELFGEGYFRSTRSNLVSGRLPCGCARSPRWSKEQFAVLCMRKATELDYVFLGFAKEYKGATTKIKILCETHGAWASGTVQSLINGGCGCPVCKRDVIAKTSAKPDSVMIQSFFASGAFHPEAKFWRSDRENSQGFKVYWFMFCPECGETGESVSSNLRKGKRPCACSEHRQTECYINQVIDDHGVVALKFGVANNSKRRVKEQNSTSTYTLKQHSVYKFPCVASCKKAERECKQELECGIILKRDMPDGYTETTWVYNLDKIIEIYERNDGIKID